MDNYTAQQILALVGALVFAILFWRFVKNIQFGDSGAARVANIMTTENRSLLDRTGDQFLERFGLSPAGWAKKLDLAHINGKFTHYTLGGLFARSFIYGIVALVFCMLMNAAPMYYVVVVIAAYWPLLQVNSAAEETQKRIGRLMPEMATVIAAELDAGANPEQALARVVTMPGPLSVLLQRARSEALSSDRPTFTTGTATGVVKEILTKENIRPLTRFAVNLDRVASIGVEGPRIFHNAARGFAHEYRKGVQKETATLETKLLFPMAVCYFIPMVISVMLPLILSLMKAF